MHDSMKKIMENMGKVPLEGLTESVAGAIRPLGVMSRHEAGPGMDLPLNSDDQPGQEEEGQGVNGHVEESISTGAMDRLIEAMVTSPKAQSLLSRYGVDASSMESLKSNLAPALSAFFSGQGIGVAGISKSKQALRGMAKI